MSEAKTTREFQIMSILTGFCGQKLTADKIDEICAEINTNMDIGPCAWAFKKEPIMGDES